MFGKVARNSPLPWISWLHGLKLRVCQYSIDLRLSAFICVQEFSLRLRASAVSFLVAATGLASSFRIMALFRFDLRPITVIEEQNLSEVFDGFTFF
jgi:hypothetical protein